MLRKSVVTVAILALVCPVMLAQGGCVNSPENPTALLALVGAAGAVVARLRSRR
jgi:XrtJ-associated TM-motif-TM protein